MKTKRLFISTLIAAAAMGLTAYANEAATQTTPVIAETDASEGADKLLPLADAPAAEDADAPAKETQDADALELLLADDALVELDEASAPDELSTETMMREWIARYAAAARFAGIRSVKGTGGGLSSGGAVATAGADFAVSAAAPTPSVSVPAAGTVSLADTLTRASAAEVSLASASASDAGTVSVATASSAAGTGTILPAAFFSTRSVFSVVPAATASYSLAGSSGDAAVMTASETMTGTNYTVTGPVKQDSATTIAPNTVNNVTGSITDASNTSVSSAIVNRGDTFTFNGVTGYLPGWDNATFEGNIILAADSESASAFIWDNGSSLNNKTITFSGSLSGSGTFEKNTGNKKQSFIFAGDVTGFSGNFLLATRDANVSTSALTFGNGGAAFTGTYENGNAKSVSGTGQISWAGQSVVFNYNNTNAATVGNSSITTKTLTFSGGANYTVSSTVTGSDSTASNNTLTISAGTTTFTGSIANFGTITVASGATLSLSGAKVSLVNAIDNSGTVNVDAATKFVLASLTGGTTSGNQTTYSLVNVNGGTLGSTWTSLNASNLDFAGSSYFQRGASATFASDGYMTVTDGTAGNLVWVGGENGAGTWNYSTTNTPWTNSGTATSFMYKDNVTFATSGAEVTIGGAILADTITISEDTTFKLASGQNQALSAASITVASGKNLQLEGAVLGTITNGISLVAADSVLTLKDVAPPNGNTISGSGKVVLNQTSSSVFTISETAFTGGISLEKIGSGTVNLSAAQSHNGGTKITGGALGVNNPNALGSGTLTLNGGTLQANANNLSFSNIVEVMEASGVNTQGNTMTLTGPVSGAGTLTKTGTGTLVLATGFGGTGDTRWTDGNLVVSAGMLQWGEGGTGAASQGNLKALGENITVSAGANLKLWLWTTPKVNTSTADKVAITSKIILNGTDFSTATLSTEDGSYYLSGGIQIGDGTNAGNGTFTAKWVKGHVIGSLSGAGTFTINETAVNDTGTAIFSIAGDGGFSGTVNFNYESGANSAGAELHLLTENALKNATVNLTSSVAGKTATLSLDAATVNIKGLKGTSAGRVVAATAGNTTAGNTLAIATENGVTNTFSGTVGTSTSAVGLSVSGSGRQKLLGTSYLGDVSVSGGALTLGGAATINHSKDSAAFTVSGGTLTFTDDLRLSLRLTGDGVLGETVKLVDISGSGSVAQTGMSLDIANITYNGKALSSRITSATFDNSTGLISFVGKALSLTWSGGNEGTWNKIATNFTSEGVATAFVNDDDVTFATAGAVVSIAEAVRAEKITISENTTFKLSSTSTNLLSATSIEVASGADLQLEGSVLGGITGGISLVATDSVLTLKDVASPNGNTISGSGKVVLNQTSSSTFTISASVFTDGISLEKIGSGTVNLNATQRHTGGTKITGGALGVNNPSALGSGTLTLNGGTLQANANNLSFSNTVKVTAASGVNTQGNTMTLSGAVSGTGTLTLNGGTLQANANNLSFSNTVKVTAASGVNTQGNTMTLSGAVSGTGTLTKAGTGTLFVTNNTNDISGTVSVAAGVLIVGAANTGGTGAVARLSSAEAPASIVVESGAAFKTHLGGGAPQNDGNVVAMSSEEFAGNFYLKDGATLGNIDGHVALTGDIVFGATDMTGAYSGSSTVTLTQHWQKTVELAGVLSGAGTVTLTSPAAQANAFYKISGDENTFSGTYKLENATNKTSTLVLSSQNAAKDAKVNLSTSGARIFLGAANVTIAELAGVSGSTIQRTTESGAPSVSTLTVNQAADTTFAGTFGSGVSLVKAGAGTLTLSGNNAFTDGVTIENGTLVAGSEDALGSGPVSIENDATLKIGVGAITINGLSGAAKTEIAAASKIALADGTENATVTLNITGDNSYSGYFDGAISLVKRGTGTLDLTGNNLAGSWGQSNTFSGTVEICEGTIKTDSTGWGSKGNLNNSFEQDKLVLKNGGVLEVTEAQNTDTENEYGKGGAMRGFSVTEGEGTYRYTGTETSRIAPNLNSNNVLQANSHIGLADGATLIFDVTKREATLEVSKVIANTTPTGTDTTSGTIEKTGAGTLKLTGDNSKHTGNVKLSAGTLELGHNKALGSSTSTLDVTGDSELKLGSDASGNALTVSNKLSLMGTLIVSSTHDGNELSGSISASGQEIRKVGSGTLTLSGTNTGENVFIVNVAEGKIIAKTDTALGAGMGADVADYHKVRLSGGTLEVGSGVTLAQTNIEITLSDLYKKETAITGAGKLADGTTIKISKAETAAMSLSAEAAQDAYKIYAETLVTADSTVNVVLSEALRAEGWSVMLKDGVYMIAIPEPSLFGLLAGVTALGFSMSSRRRRKKA